jgi:CsoR family transcriptional regulator, copper-sensing transcriptional repressor
MTATATGFSTAVHPGSASTPPGYHDRKAGHLARLAKIEGQVRGIARMVGNDRYCADVLTQVSAVNRALEQVALSLLDEHTQHCVLGAARSDPASAEEKLTELNAALRRALRV